MYYDQKAANCQPAINACPSPDREPEIRARLVELERATTETHGLAASLADRLASVLGPALPAVGQQGACQAPVTELGNYLAARIGFTESINSTLRDILNRLEI